MKRLASTHLLSPLLLVGLTATAIGCATQPPGTTAPATPRSDRQVLAADVENLDFDAILASLPARVDASEADKVLVDIDPALIRDEEPPSYSVQTAGGRGGHGSWGARSNGGSWRSHSNGGSWRSRSNGGGRGSWNGRGDDHGKWSGNNGRGFVRSGHPFRQFDGKGHGGRHRFFRRGDNFFPYYNYGGDFFPYDNIYAPFAFGGLYSPFLYGAGGGFYPYSYLNPFAYGAGLAPGFGLGMPGLGVPGVGMPGFGVPGAGLAGLGAGLATGYGAGLAAGQGGGNYGSYSTGTTTGQVAQTPSNVQNAAVAISNESYQPASITIKRGGTVTWTNQDQVEHTATGQNNTFDTGKIQPGVTSSTVSFPNAGVYEYSCTIHPQMKGTVIVQ